MTKQAQKQEERRQRDEEYSEKLALGLYRLFPEIDPTDAHEIQEEFTHWYGTEWNDVRGRDLRTRFGIIGKGRIPPEYAVLLTAFGYVLQHYTDYAELASKGMPASLGELLVAPTVLEILERWGLESVDDRPPMDWLR